MEPRRGRPDPEIEQAIIEGEYHAFGSTAGVLVSRVKGILSPQSDVPSRLARSFGGSTSDRFIQSRIPGLHDRVLAAMLPSKPRRGFDALVDTLRKRPEVLAELERADDGARAAIADLLGAEAGDLVVRNLLARLRVLAAGG